MASRASIFFLSTLANLAKLVPGMENFSCVAQEPRPGREGDRSGRAKMEQRPRKKSDGILILMSRECSRDLISLQDIYRSNPPTRLEGEPWQALASPGDLAASRRPLGRFPPPAADSADPRRPPALGPPPG